MPVPAQVAKRTRWQLIAALVVVYGAVAVAIAQVSARNSQSYFPTPGRGDPPGPRRQEYRRRPRGGHRRPRPPLRRPPTPRPPHPCRARAPVARRRRRPRGRGRAGRPARPRPSTWRGTVR
jgi:hypothetical protein